jgi:hypothetical protein
MQAMRIVSRLPPSTTRRVSPSPTDKDRGRSCRAGQQQEQGKGGRAEHYGEAAESSSATSASALAHFRNESPPCPYCCAQSSAPGSYQAA